jgi:hypothetical protein
VTADIKTVSVDVDSKAPSALALRLRAAVVERLKAGGTLTPLEDRNAADARLRIAEPAPGRFTIQFIGDEGTLWTERVAVPDPADVDGAADRVTRKAAATVLEARRRSGAPR